MVICETFDLSSHRVACSRPGAVPVPMTGRGPNIFWSIYEIQYSIYNDLNNSFINEEHKLAWSCPRNIFAYIGTHAHHHFSIHWFGGWGALALSPPPLPLDPPLYHESTPGNLITGNQVLAIFSIHQAIWNNLVACTSCKQPDCLEVAWCMYDALIHNRELWQEKGEDFFLM